MIVSSCCKESVEYYDGYMQCSECGEACTGEDDDDNITVPMMIGLSNYYKRMERAK